MQNTASIQSHPDTLIKNFFMAGASQSSLQREFDGKDVDALIVEPFKPEILFSMYSKKTEVEPYLDLIYPRQVVAKFDKALCMPTFHTFVSTDDAGKQSYYHTLIYYEHVSKEGIINDFDINKAVRKLQYEENMKRRQESRFASRQSRQSTGLNQSSRNSTTMESEENEEELAFEPTRAPRLNVQKLQTCTVPGASERQRKMEQEQLINRINTLQSKKCNLVQTDGGNLACIQEEVYEEKHVQNTSSMLIQSNDQQSSGEIKHSFHGESSGNNSSLNINQEEDVIMFIPNAMVIQTEIEQHDIFRELMLDLFESIRVPAEGKNMQGEEIKLPFEERRLLSFAEFIARIAWLKTIPCPTFNTRYNLQFFSKTLVINEKPFNTIPMTNQIALKLLLKLLDIKSIIFCWKALLFDYTLVLISSQFSLQFNIAEALKQLMFPLVWQYNQVQPANKTTIDLIESPSPLIFCCSDEDAHHMGLSAFEYILELQKDGFKNIAVCDIDGKFTNESDSFNSETGIKFPDVFQEQFLVRNLNILMNKQMQSFDKAYPDINSEQQEASLVSDVRELFFNILKPILLPLFQKESGNYLYIDTNKDAADVGTVFEKYFNKEDFLELFEGPGYDFVKKLVDGGAFQHFCDDFFNTDSDLTNRRMFEAIINYKDVDTENQFDAIRPVEKRMVEKQSSMKRGSCTGGDSTMMRILKDLQQFPPWPLQKPVVIDWRMPQDLQRVILFDKLLFFLERHHN